MTDLVQYTLQNGVATLTLNNGKVNAFSHEMIADFNDALDQAEQDEAVVVITGRIGMLSAGYDLKVMQQSMESAMALVEKGSTLTRRLLSFPFPVIVACSGHAIAKGAFILLAADYRIGLDGEFKLGLNEVAIGMTMHHAGITLAEGRLSSVYFNRSVINAEMYSPTAAVEAGFLDCAVDHLQFQATIDASALAFTKLNMKAHKQTKLKARADLLAKLDEAIKLDVGGSL